jgi:hypothetical protein
MLGVRARSKHRHAGLPEAIARRKMPIEMLVVTHIERTPTEN